MMKKKVALVFVLVIVGTLVLSACGNKAPQRESPYDYMDAETFEKALNEGEDTVGKTVEFVINDVKPDSALGYNLWAGEHLNFLPIEKPEAKAGESIVVRVISVEMFVDSWVINCTTNLEGELPDGSEVIIPEGTPVWITNLFDSVNRVVAEENLPVVIGFEKSKASSGDYDVYDILFDSADSYIGERYKYKAPNLNIFGNEAKYYKVQFYTDSISNAEVRRDIAITVAASEGLSYADASAKCEEMLNSFSGTDKSKDLLLEHYNYVITPSFPGVIDFIVAPKPEPTYVIKESDTAATNELFQGALNVSSWVYLTGTVVENRYDDSTSFSRGVLVVQNSEGVYNLFYQFSDFTGAFETGKTYIFYGAIAEKQASCDGCMNLYEYATAE